MTNKDNPQLDVVRRNLKLALALRDFSAAEASRAAGLSRNALSQFITGKTSLSYANMLATCAAIDVPIGLMHRPDSITTPRIRLYRLLERMPDHLAAEAVQNAQAILDHQAPRP